MIRRPPRSTRPDTLLPSTTLFRSVAHIIGEGARQFYLGPGQGPRRSAFRSPEGPHKVFGIIIVGIEPVETSASDQVDEPRRPGTAGPVPDPQGAVIPCLVECLEVAVQPAGRFVLRRNGPLRRSDERR